MSEPGPGRSGGDCRAAVAAPPVQSPGEAGHFVAVFVDNGAGVWEYLRHHVGYEAGAWDSLSKPVDIDQMLTVLRAWLFR